MSTEPKGCHDLDGWTPVTCWQAEIVRRHDLTVVSSYTHVDVPDVFSEWWTVASDKVARSVPVLREYRDKDGCRHYLAEEPSKAAREVES